MKRLLICLIIPFLSFGQIDSLNVLFVGNSYTASNNLPNIVSTIANSMGDYLYTESNLIGGATLQTHVNNNTTNNLIMNGDWDYVSIQEQSQYPSFPIWQVEQDVFPYATQLNQLISDYNDYNTHIDAHKEANMKKYVYETDDINYPFYIIQPNSHPGLCLNLESGELGEFNIRIKPCSNNKTERFEALLYETFNGCNSEPTTISQ